MGIKLGFHASFLVLSIIHGEDAAMELFGVLPFKGRVRDLAFLVARHEVIGYGLRAMKDWSKVGKSLMDTVLRELPLIKHCILQEELHRGGDAVEELTSLMSIPHFNS